MSDATVDRLLAERERYIERAKSIRTSAEATERKLTDDELKIIQDCNTEVDDLDRQLMVVTHDLAMPDEIRDRIGRASGLSRSARESAPYQTVGQVVWDAIHAERDDEARIRYTGALQRAASSGSGRIPLDRAADHMGTNAATTMPVAGDLGGLVVRPNVGPVINPYPGTMPLASALGLQDAPAGVFGRPFIVDPNFPDGGMGPQGEGTANEGFEKAELPSEKFDADTQELKLGTIGGYLNVSSQLLRWVPGALDVIIGQMNRRRSAKIEKLLVTEMGLSTGHVDLPADADFETTWQAIVDAVALVGKGTGEGPTVLAMGWDGYARLAGFTDAAGRPLFPFMGPTNAPGSANLSDVSVSSVAGIRPVITSAITDDTFWVLNGMGLEGFVYYYGVLEAVEPSVLGRQVAVAADFKASRPTPTANTAIHLRPATP